MRYYILDQVSGGRLLDLNGNAKRDDAKRFPGDQNVFDIQQGVAISVFWRREPKNGLAPLLHGALFGNRANKYQALIETPSKFDFQPISPTPEYYLFESSEVSRPLEYETWPKLDEVMPFGGTGVKTNRDDFVIDFEDEPILIRMQIFRDKNISDSEAQRILSIGENYTWKIPKQRRLFRLDVDHDRIRNIDYRPFDNRRIYYQRHVVYNPRFETMKQVCADNVFLLLCRQQFETGFRHVLVTRRMFECCLVSAKSREITSGFPLYVFDKVDPNQALLPKGGRRLNLSFGFQEKFKQVLGEEILDSLKRSENSKHVSGEQVLSYFYAILHSPEYRRRYAESLKIDFPRVPFPRHVELFRDLARFGGDLLSLHLLESRKLDKPIMTYTGPRNPAVEKISYADQTLWLDKAQTRGFQGVPEEVWNFHIGGYQVCEKWLKDRKGRTLSKDDVAHYHRIVVALHETIRLMGEIDEVIDRHGGWPSAFNAGAPEKGAEKG